MLIPEGPPASATSARQRSCLDEHNGIAQLTALLFETACLLSIHPVIEQPQSSLLFHYKPVESVLNKFEAMHIAFQMAAFGGSSPKPLIIRGVGRFLQVFKDVYIRRKATASTTTQRLTTHKGKAFTGHRSDLTQSSSYTRTFGIAMTLCFKGLSAREVCSKLDACGL